jgi:hypothetical protein
VARPWDEICVSVCYRYKSSVIITLGDLAVIHVTPFSYTLQPRTRVIYTWSPLYVTNSYLFTKESGHFNIL